MKNELEFQKLKGLMLWCNKCKSDIHGKKGKKCDHPIARQVYKAVVVIPNSVNGRKTKNLKSKDFGGAVKEFLEFKEQVKNPILYQESDKKTQSPYLEDTLAMYIDYMQDVDVSHHLKNHISKDRIKIVISNLKSFVSFLVKKGANLNTYKLSSINDSVVGTYCDFLEKKNGSNYTYNDKIKVLRTFYSYLIEKEDYNLKNVWKKVKLKSEKPTNISISDKDFYNLLSVISPEDPMGQIGKKRRNMYRLWLKDLIKLKAYTGRRNAELFNMRWNMIHYENDMPIYIESPNIKVNRQQNNFDEKDYVYAYVPVGDELFELLVDLNLEENQNSNEYIIEPEVENRDNIRKYASIYFTFFFKKLKRDYIRQLRHLRQTYVTRESLFVNGGFSMQHSNYRTTEKHYIDKREVAKQMVKHGFRIFPKQNQKCTPVLHSSYKKRHHIHVIS